MLSFEKSTYIKCQIDDLFDFHLDSQNLTRITPPNIKVTLLTPNFKARKDEILKLSSIKNFIKTSWVVKIDKLDKPNILIDKALKSPFKYWEHHHIFIDHGDYCELKDVVLYKMPFGFIGELFKFLIQKDLNSMFDFRHKVTKQILEKKVVV